MLRRRHLELIAKHSVRHSIRGGAGLIAVLSTLTIGLIMASVVVSPLEAIERQMQQGGGDASITLDSPIGQEVLKIAKQAMGWAMGASDAQVNYLVSDKPALVSAILILLMLVAPSCACLAAFNQTSGDIATRGLRYLLIRTERQNIFLGRFIGTTLFMAAVYAVLFIVLGLYLVFKIQVHPKGDMMLWLAGGYLRVMLFSLPYIALCAWVSGAVASPFGSLVLAIVFAYIWPLFVMVASRTQDALGYGQYLTPWGFKWWLFSERPWLVALGSLVMVAFTGVLLALGMRQFVKRDL